MDFPIKDSSLQNILLLETWRSRGLLPTGARQDTKKSKILQLKVYFTFKVVYNSPLERELATFYL